MMKVLNTKRQISKARNQLLKMDASCIEPYWKASLRRFGINLGVPVGDILKSWDVLLTLEFIQAHHGQGEPILDIGAYASEVVVALHKLGFTNLSAVDLNPRLSKMPFNQIINYTISDFLHTPFEDSTFTTITSTSAIEHGYDGQSLMCEVSRLLKPNGHFIASFDYWPDKIDTSTTKFFGMDWLIFSRSDVNELIEIASENGLSPVGSIDSNATEKTINCSGYDYTFGWLVLQKS